MKDDSKKKGKIDFGVIKTRQKIILKHEFSYSKIGGHVLTVKFGKPLRVESAGDGCCLLFFFCLSSL